MHLFLFPQHSMSADMINIKVTFPSSKKESTYISAIAPVLNFRNLDGIYVISGQSNTIFSISLHSRH